MALFFWLSRAKPSELNSSSRVCVLRPLYSLRKVFFGPLQRFFCIHFATKYVHFTNSCHYTRYVCMIMRCPFVVIWHAYLVADRIRAKHTRDCLTWSLSLYHLFSHSHCITSLFFAAIKTHTFTQPFGSAYFQVIFQRWWRSSVAKSTEPDYRLSTRIAVKSHFGRKSIRKRFSFGCCWCKNKTCIFMIWMFVALQWICCSSIQKQSNVVFAP